MKIIPVFAAVVTLLAATSGAMPRRLTKEDLDRVVRVEHDASGSVSEVSVRGDVLIRFRDLDHDGKNEAVELWERGKLVCRRWYGSTNGPPFGGTLFFGDDSVTASWGIYREDEADEQRRKMERQLPPDKR